LREARVNRFTVLSALLGSALIVGGFSMIYRPLGFIGAGALFLGITFASARNKRVG
jgi:hypothetical protein